MVSFEEFWRRMKKEMGAWPKPNNEDRYRYSTIPKRSAAEKVSGNLSCRYADGEDMVQYKTKNDRWASADQTDFETLYNDWNQYSQEKLEKSRLRRDLNRRTSYTIPTLFHFEHLMH